ncbi:MAG: hypothetical protein P4L66_15960 [Acetobacteraceae bacterium]|nr:hypothetical protein [Acetobacteraceae bacterium]
MPEGDAVAISRIGGCKAVSAGFLVLGLGTDEIIAFVSTSKNIAVAWRSVTIEILGLNLQGQPFDQPDWLGLAHEADPVWAAANWPLPPDVDAPGNATTPAAPSPSQPNIASPMPRRADKPND